MMEKKIFSDMHHCKKITSCALCHKATESCIPQKQGSKPKLGKAQDPPNRKSIMKETKGNPQNDGDG